MSDEDSLRMMKRRGACLGNASRSGSIADGANVIWLGRGARRMVLLADFLNLAHGIEFNALRLRRKERATALAASSLSPSVISSI